MTKLLIADDGSDTARDAVQAAALLFPTATATRLRVAEGSEPEEEGVEVVDAFTVWRAVVQAADERGADLIVCGTRGHGMVSRALLGSTSSALLHHADRPVLIVPGVPDDGPLAIAYDGSDGATQAIEVAARLFHHRPTVVAHAWVSPLRRSYAGAAIGAMPLPEGDELVRDLTDMFAGDAQETTDAGVGLAAESGLPARGVVREAETSVWRTLAAIAADEGAAVLVAGSRGRGAVKSTVLGSVSASLAHNAERPVLIVR